jgi:hypothetical protein
MARVRRPRKKRSARRIPPGGARSSKITRMLRPKRGAMEAPPTHLADAFFIEPFSFSKKQRQEFGTRDITDDVVAKLEEALAEPKSCYESVQAPRPLFQREALQALHKAFVKCAERLEKTDRLTLAVLNAEALPKTGVNVLEAWELIIKYGEAAQKTAKGTRVKRGPDARRDTHLAVIVGQTLENAGISLDGKLKGKFVSSTVIVFEAMDIHKKEARNAVRRALEIKGKADW